MYAEDGKVTNLGGLHAEDSSLGRAWQVYNDMCGGGLGIMCDSLPVMTWLSFLYDCHANYAARTVMPEWLPMQLAEWMNLCVFFLEMFVHMEVQKPEYTAWGVGNELMDLRLRKKRRQAVDPLLYSHFQQSRRKIRGSARTITEAIAGSKSNHETNIVRHTNKLYLDGARNVLQGLNDYCLNWDPSTYSGFEWNIGLWYSIDMNLSGIIPPTVPC